MPTNAERLIRYCSALEWANADYLGYIPKPALLKYAERNQIIPAFDNDELCGYILFNDNPGPKLRYKAPATLRIYQTCIQNDARRILHGTQLLQALLNRPTTQTFRYLDCFVNQNIPANDFWTTLGFTLIGSRPGGQKRHRTLNHYRYTIPADDHRTSHPTLVRTTTIERHLPTTNESPNPRHTESLWFR